MSDTIRIAQWTFAPETGVVENGDASTRLEHRAAALLDLLAATPGQLVTHSEIIDQVWEGRTVSPNSVAVVISDIRKALGDDPKAPRFIETLPKRGYRLIAATQPDTDSADSDLRGAAPPARRMPLLAYAALPLIAALVFVMGRNYAASPVIPDAMSITLAGAVNETGDARYDPLTVSVTELLAVELGRHEGLTISTEREASVIVSGKLILWDGHPSMSIHAQSVSTGEIIWSGMASGPETLLPRQVREEISEFAAMAEDAADG
nr:winged helix-turn-helix domain-containing protein [Hyphomonas sp. Mor2]